MIQAAIAAAATLTLPATVTSVTPINRSATLAAGLDNGQVVVWNGSDSSPTVLLKPHTVRVVAVGWSADGRAVWSLASDGSLARTAATAGAKPTSQQLDVASLSPRLAAFSADGSMVAVGGDFGEVRVFDTATGSMKQRFRGHRTELQALAFRAGSATVASASAESDLRVWDAVSGRQLGSLEGDLSTFAAGFSPRDGILASGGADRRLTLRDSKTLKPVWDLTFYKPQMIGTLSWSADGRFLAFGDVDDETLKKGGIQVVDANKRDVIAELDTKGVVVRDLTFLGDGDTVVANLGKELRAWRLPER
jgi:WD40 repeat protein